MNVFLSPANKRTDQDAFERIVRPHLSGLYHAALVVTLSQEAAEDAVQEGLLRAYASFHRFHGDQYRAWLYRIVLNEAKRQRRSLWRRPAPLDLFVAAAGPDASPEESALDNMMSRELWQAVCKLSKDHRTVLVLRYLLEMSEAEMAAILAIPAGTVKSRLHHARRILEERLRKSGMVQSMDIVSGTERRPSHA